MNSDEEIFMFATSANNYAHEMHAVGGFSDYERMMTRFKGRIILTGIN